MAQLRRLYPALTFLVPGIGAQGGDLDATLNAGLDAGGGGLLINSARGIIYAGGGAAHAIRGAAGDLREAINRRRRRSIPVTTHS
jgi:orotidine-5'-phosphate decarboxylase